MSPPGCPGDRFSARSVFGIRHQIPDLSEPVRVPACQGCPAQCGDARLPPLALGPCRQPAQPILTSGGSLCFQSPETLPHPRHPVKGQCRGPKPRFQRRASSHHGRPPAVRRGCLLAPPEPNEYRTSTLLCQVRGPSRFRSGSPQFAGPAGNLTNIPPNKHYVK